MCLPVYINPMKVTRLNYLYFVDIDECAINLHLCQHNCHNNNGSYTCSCDSGYIMDINGHSCDGEIVSRQLLSQ